MARSRQTGRCHSVHAGTYVSDRLHYMNGAARPGYLALGTVFDGTYYLTASGTPDKPIVIKGACDGEAIIDGDGAQNLFNLMAGNYNYFEGLTIRNTNVAFLLGIKDIAGSSGFTSNIRRSVTSAAQFKTTGRNQRTTTSPTTLLSDATIRTK
jgi:hypothetical protein